MRKERLTRWGILSLILILTMSLVLAGCGTQEEQVGTNVNQDGTAEETTTEETQANEATDTNESDQTNTSEEANKGDFPVTITDGTGQEVTINAEPESIISVIPSNTEIAFALGLGDKIVGVSDYCNYPAEALEKEKIGARDLNVEMILTLLPDLILVTEYQHNSNALVLDQFREAGITVLVINSATSFEDVYASIDLIAQATGSTDKAEEIITDMQERLEVLKDKAKAVSEPKKVWVEVSPAPDIYTTGKGTFMNEMLESIQAINTAGDEEGWIKLTEEEIVKLNPEVIITTYGYYVENPAQGVLSREGWAEVPAIKNEQVFDVDNDTVTRPGPRLIDGVETLAKLIYPEIFNQ